MAKSRRLPPIHPGEILREDFIVPLGISMNKLALDLRVPVTRIAEIVHERRGITPDTALRLGRYFNTSARFWLNAQAAYDLEVAQDELGSAVVREAGMLARQPVVDFSFNREGAEAIERIPEVILVDDSVVVLLAHDVALEVPPADVYGVRQ